MHWISAYIFAEGSLCTRWFRPGDSAASFRGLQDTTSSPQSDADCMLDLLDWRPTVSTSTDLPPSSLAFNDGSRPYPMDTSEPRLADSTCSGSRACSSPLESGCLTDLLDAPDSWQDASMIWQEAGCSPNANHPTMPSKSSSLTEPELKPSIGLSLSPSNTASPGGVQIGALDALDLSDPWSDTSLMLDDMMPFDMLDGVAQLSDLDTLSDLPATEESAPSNAQPPSSLSRETSCTLSSGISTQLAAPAVGQRTTRRYKQKTGRPRRYDTYVAPVEEPEGKSACCQLRLPWVACCMCCGCRRINMPANNSGQNPLPMNLFNEFPQTNAHAHAHEFLSRTVDPDMFD